MPTRLRRPQDLVGTTVTVVDDRGTRITHSFAETTVLVGLRTRRRSDETPPPRRPTSTRRSRSTTSSYFVQFHHEYLAARGRVARAGPVYRSRPRRDQRASATRAPERTARGARLRPARIDGARRRGVPSPRRRRRLVGKRALWVYSPVHAYEHVYLSPAVVHVALPRRPRARPGRHRPVLRLAGAARHTRVRLAGEGHPLRRGDDRRPPRARALRSHGVLFGADETGTVTRTSPSARRSGVVDDGLPRRLRSRPSR